MLILSFSLDLLLTDSKQSSFNDCMYVSPNLYVILVCCTILLPRYQNMKHLNNRIEDQLNLYLFFLFEFRLHYLHQQNQPHAHVLIKTDMA